MILQIIFTLFFLTTGVCKIKKSKKDVEDLKLIIVYHQKVLRYIFVIIKINNKYYSVINNNIYILLPGYFKLYL